MNWFFKFTNKLNIIIGSADLGEYWIIDGESVYADGDVGDINHDGYVYEYIANQLQDVGVREVLQQQIDSGQLTPEQKEQAEEDYPGLFTYYGGNYEEYCDPQGGLLSRVVHGAFSVDEIEALNSIVPGYLGYNGMPKDYAVEHLGWIRAIGTNFETKQVTESVLSEIVDHVDSLIFDGLGQENDNLEVCINEQATGAYLCFNLDELRDAVQTGRGLVLFRQRQRVEKFQSY